MSDNNYMQVLPFDEERQRKIYKKCTKKQLIDFLIQRDKIREYNRGKTKREVVITSSSSENLINFQNSF